MTSVIVGLVLKKVSCFHKHGVLQREEQMFVSFRRSSHRNLTSLRRKNPRTSSQPLFSRPQSQPRSQLCLYRLLLRSHNTKHQRHDHIVHHRSQIHLLVFWFGVWWICGYGVLVWIYHGKREWEEDEDRSNTVISRMNWPINSHVIKLMTWQSLSRERENDEILND